ncbi:laccase lcc5 [Pluteus cervinus]|uniref:Laccase lcc5 n=1 Tax=Pluteus cervinus TaxID=181527 RepID=A0ACD3B1R3_9AGAR|nr:laccase lcc5 [Pluteus cervinus]
MFSPTYLSLLLLPLANAAIGPIANLPITNRVIAPDGFNRSTVLAGGTFPGPLIKGFKGNRFMLNVQDQLTDNTMLLSTSIHWHGLFQGRTPWNDGPVGVSQCPIAPGHSFTYDFTVPDQAGTFWYHSHYSTQYCDGLRGPFVVYDPFDPHHWRYDVDDESTVITLADWYHSSARSNILPVPDSTLINGLGRWSGGSPTSALAVVNVKHGLRYRFRLVSISCDPNFVFSIDGHNMTIIEVDGVNAQPYTVDQLTIFAGQRYSFVLNANQPVGNYWIRALPNDRQDPTLSFENGINSAILRYQGAPASDPTSPEVTRTNVMVEASLAPLVSTPAIGNHQIGDVDVPINLAMGVDFTNGKFTINGATFKPPTVPVLLQILSGQYTPQQLLPSGSVYVLPRNKVVELTIPGLDIGGPHPFHLHGHNFQVIRTADSSTPNWKNPVIRDVVSTGTATGGSNVTIRFNTNNPGPWILHCHIDWHLELGLAVVFAEDVPDDAHLKPPPSWNNLCPIYNALDPSQQ